MPPDNTIVTVTNEIAPQSNVPAVLRYRNGREAARHDLVLYRDSHSVVRVGCLKFTVGQTSTRVLVSCPTSGGLGADTVEVGLLVHAEDALALVDEALGRAQ